MEYFRDKFPAWNSYNYCMGNPVVMVNLSGKAPKDIIVTNRAGRELFRLDDGRKEITRLTAQQLYDRGVQWFEPTANNYMPIISMTKDVGSVQGAQHFSWSQIAAFAEEDRFMTSYRPGGAGDWKADGKPGDGFLLSTVGGQPYWTDAIGQIPFAVDKFTDELESSGSSMIARQRTIAAGRTFGDGIGINQDDGNSYDNAMILRAVNWAEKRYKVVGENSWYKWDDYEIRRTNYSPDNLSKPSAP